MLKPELTPEEKFELRARIIGVIGFSALALIAGLYVILFGHYPDDIRCWAIGLVGLVLGFWLSPVRGSR